MLGLSNEIRTVEEKMAVASIMEKLNKRLANENQINGWLDHRHEVLGGYTPRFFMNGRNAKKILRLMDEGEL